MLVKLIEKEVLAGITVLTLVTVKVFPLKLHPIAFEAPPETDIEQVELVDG